MEGNEASDQTAHIGRLDSIDVGPLRATYVRTKKNCQRYQRLQIAILEANGKKLEQLTRAVGKQRFDSRVW